MTNGLPTDILEERAAEQRRRLHESVSELRSTMRERLDLRRNAREYSRTHLPQAAVAAGVLGLALGWAFGRNFD